MLYETLKALHIIAVIAWMAGLLYLPRLFVYHADTAPGSPQSETFKIMERRLLRGIMGPTASPGIYSSAFFSSGVATGGTLAGGM